MSSARRRNRWLLGGAILAVLAIDVCVARVFWRDDGRHERYLARARAETQRALELDDIAAESSARRSSEHVAERPDSLETDPDRVGTGVLLVRVHEARSGRPVVGATCVVYAERLGQHQYGVLTTDSQGCATIGHLPENTILVHVLRNPPHASGYGGVWLRNGASREVDVALTAGGSVFGRVVDDVGHPVVDADVMLSSQPWMPDHPRDSEPESIMHTGPGGRFEVPYVVSDPECVWIVGGEMRAASWGGVEVLVRAGLAHGSVRSEVPDGSRIDLGDVIVPREREYAGHIWSAHREPISGALIDSHPHASETERREFPPVESTFDATGPDRTLTESDGSFRLRCGEARDRIVVTTREGFLQSFRLPRAAPGSRTDDLDLVLADESMLEIELVNELGERLSCGHSIGDMSGWEMCSPDVPTNFDWRAVEVRLELPSGLETRSRLRPDRDELYRLQSPGSAARRIRLAMVGYLPVDEELGVPARRIERHRFTLHPMPTVRLHVRVSEQPRGSPEFPLIDLQACMAEPVRFAQWSSHESHCCGLGSNWSGVPIDEKANVTLPVLAAGEYWIYAFAPAGHPVGTSGSWCLWQEHFGPFMADGQVHDIYVPPIAPDPERERGLQHDVEMRAPDRTEPEANPVHEVESSALSPDAGDKSTTMHQPVESHASVEPKPTHAIEVLVDGAIQQYPFASVTAWLKPVNGERTDADSLELWGSLPLPDGRRRFQADVSGTGEFRIVVRSMLLQPLSRTITLDAGEGVQQFTLSSVR